MEQFIIRFLVCNIFLSAIAGLLLLLKHLFRNHLTSRMQYGLCHPFFLLLTFASFAASYTGAIISLEITWL